MTTDIKELVKRLRDVETRERILGFGGSETLLLFSKEAADAIEALAGEVKRLQGMLNIFAGFSYSTAEKIAIAKRGFVEEK